MIFKLTVTFEESKLTKLEKDSKPYVISTWSEVKFYRTAEEKESILKDWKRVEYSETSEVSARPYRNGTIEEITSVKIKSIEEIPLYPVTKYFFLYSEDVGVNECPDGFGGTEYQDEITSWSKSEYFDDEETAYFESLNYKNTSPIMKGVIYENIKEEEK